MKAPLGNFKFPSARFFHVHIELVRPLPVSSGLRYCLTAIDWYTRWPEAVPLSDITAEAVGKAFVFTWFARFGCPQQIITDQGSQFEARLFKTLAAITGFSLTRTTVWLPLPMALSRGYTVRRRPQSCAMPMNIGPKLYRWSCWRIAGRGRRICKLLQTNYSMVLPCGYRGILRPFHRRLQWCHWIHVTAEGPHWKASSHTSIQACSNLSRSSSRTWPQPRIYFYGMVPPGEPSKPHISALTGSYPGVIRPIPLTFRILRIQSPLTVWSRRMSSMFTPNPLPRRAFLPVSRHAPGGRHVFRITWGCSVLSREVMCWVPQASPPT